MLFASHCAERGPGKELDTSTRPSNPGGFPTAQRGGAERTLTRSAPPLACVFPAPSFLHPGHENPLLSSQEAALAGTGSRPQAGRREPGGGSRRPTRQQPAVVRGAAAELLLASRSGGRPEGAAP